MSKFYNYDTRGASYADQLIWFEDKVERLEDQLEKERAAHLETGNTLGARCQSLVDDNKALRSALNEVLLNYKVAYGKIGNVKDL